MHIVKYDQTYKERWDAFVKASRNGTFLFYRDYMEYHRDRFEDYSLMLMSDDYEILAMLPANVVENRLYSHQGLTYGGWIMGYRTFGNDPLAWFEILKEYLTSHGIVSLQYKPVPHIYHTHPCEEDLYALFRQNARLTVRNLSTVIEMRNPIKSSRLGKRAIKRQKASDIIVKELNCADEFWPIIVEDRRVRHNTKPVHNAAEMNLLHGYFPKNIRFFGAYKDGKIEAGAVIYYDRDVIHLQYAAATPYGKDIYATDVIYHELIFNICKEAKCFDFGISNENAGQYLNEGMVHHKEEFGGRSVVYDAYTLDF